MSKKYRRAPGAAVFLCFLDSTESFGAAAAPFVIKNSRCNNPEWYPLSSGAGAYPDQIFMHFALSCIKTGKFVLLPFGWQVFLLSHVRQSCRLPLSVAIFNFCPVERWGRAVHCFADIACNSSVTVLCACRKASIRICNGEASVIYLQGIAKLSLTESRFNRLSDYVTFCAKKSIVSERRDWHVLQIMVKYRK